jgi:predicted metal-binding membrane protein
VSTASDYLPELGLDGIFDLRFDRATTAVLAMIGLDALWWVMLWDGHVPMPGMTWLMQEASVPMAAPGAMELGVFHVGTLGAVIDYTAMWGVMMWAMMHPPMARFARDYSAAHRGSTTRATLSVTSFLTSYHIVWALSAVLPLAFHLLLPGGIYGFTRAHTHPVIGGVLVLTGLYQLTAFKQRLLRDCCGNVAPHADDIPEAFREGARHGTRCLLICFGPFFLLMPFFGEMNLFWMVALTTVVTIERLPTWGREIAVSIGTVSLAAGLCVLLLRPELPISFTMSMGM